MRVQNKWVTGEVYRNNHLSNLRVWLKSELWENRAGTPYVFMISTQHLFKTTATCTSPMQATKTIDPRNVIKFEGLVWPKNVVAIGEFRLPANILDSDLRSSSLSMNVTTASLSRWLDQTSQISVCILFSPAPNFIYGPRTDSEKAKKVNKKEHWLM